MTSINVFFGSRTLDKIMWLCFLCYDLCDDKQMFTICDIRSHAVSLTLIVDCCSLVVNRASFQSFTPSTIHARLVAIVCHRSFKFVSVIYCSNNCNCLIKGKK